ncbi:MAG: ABC transporter permease, partial [Thermodesulfovibrionia bacterium]|nr:ABC transporter permease [Thermodesulfovibrionia bacterium]
MNWLEKIGLLITSLIEEMGRIMMFFIETVGWIFRPPLNLRNIFKQMVEIGVNSAGVVIIMASFTGMVLALQSYTGFKRFNAESLVGTVVALSMTRELGPVLTGLIVAGRAGASMAAELGTMRVTEQIDALATMATNPIKFLAVPRFLAGLIMLPLLTVISNVLGIFGGYLVGVKVLDANPTVYMRRTFDYLEVDDIYSGLFKAAIFGMVIAVIS